jgi:uncharacterized protein YeaO (DUF488 family)
VDRIRLKRAYDPPGPSEGSRFLVDRLWPRGVAKESLPLEGWLKEIAPSTELRKWFGHNPRHWEEFRRRYWAELSGNEKGLEPIFQALGLGPVTLVYSAKDAEHNNAVVLKEFLEQRGPL